MKQVSDKQRLILEKWVSEYGARQAGVKIIDNYLRRLGLSSSDLPDSMAFSNGLDSIQEFLESRDYGSAIDIAVDTAKEMLEGEGFPGMFENKNKLKINNHKMKRVTYKKEFTNIEDALTKVPNSLKENNNVFEMTDGNQTYKVRWEGSLTEGKAVALLAKDEKLISEDMKHMKHLMGYTSEPTLGTPKGNDRVSENKTFTRLLGDSKKKSLIESNLTEEELLDEGFVDNLRNGIITVAMIVGFLNSANAQNPKAVKMVRDSIAANYSPEKTQQLKQAVKKVSGVEFSDEVVNDIFDFAPADKEFVGKKVPDLYLGKYKGVAKITKQNFDGKGGVQYFVDVQSQKYVDNIRHYIASNNNNLRNSVVNLTINGSPMPSKTINLK